MPPTWWAGPPNLGGPIVTAGGQGMPMTYLGARSRTQFVVIAAGGHGNTDRRARKSSGIRPAPRQHADGGDPVLDAIWLP